MAQLLGTLAVLPEVLAPLGWLMTLCDGIQVLLLVCLRRTATDSHTQINEPLR